MKKIFFFTMSSLLCFSAFSQKLALITSADEMKGSFLAGDQQAFYQSDYSEETSGSFHLYKYATADLKEIYSSPKIKVPEIAGGSTIIKTFVLVDGELILFTTLFDKEYNSNSLYATRINSDGSLDHESILVSKITSYSKKLKGFFRVRLTENKKSILILSELPSNETDSIRYTWKVIDKNLKTIWDRSVNLPYYGISSDLVVKMDYKNDKIYFISTNLKNISVKDRKKAPAENKLFCYDLKTSKLTEVLLSIETRSLFDLDINFNAKDQVILTGLYSYSKVLDKQVFFNETRSLRTENGAICEIYNENLEKAVYKDSIENKGNGFEFYINDVFLQDDGTVILVSENKDKTGSYKDGVSSADYYSGDVLIHGFDPNTKTTWIKRIQKQQHDVVDQELFSTISISRGNGILLIVNDNRKNKPENTENSSAIVIENFSLDKNAKTIILEIDNKGNIRKNESVQEFSDSKIVVRCKYKNKISANEKIFLLATDNGNKGGKLIIE